jgi:single-strand DNA-binding protein
MNTIVGRVTRDATVKNLKDDRQVVEFSVAVNDFYKKKGEEKGVNVATFYNCSFWLNPKSAERLRKGALVQVFGRLSVNTYTDLQGNAKASLNFHVNSFIVHQQSKSETVNTTPACITEPVDDLPF